MGEAIGEILGPALGIAISPIPIIAIILMLFSQRAAANSTAFLVGWIAGITVVVVVVLAILQSQDLHQSSGEPATWVSVLVLALGLLLLAAGAKGFRDRPGPDDEVALPKWLQAIDSGTPGKALGLGFVLSAANPKTLLFGTAAAITIAQAGLSGSEDAVVVAVFVLLASSTVAAPVVLYRVLGERAQPTLDSMKAWLTQNNATVMAVLYLVFGIVLLGKGIGPLLP